MPYCSVRCGYCDFNTYVPGERASETAHRWRAAALAELDFARARLPGASDVDTVFIGGGTPTVLPASDIAAVLARIDDVFGLAADAEVTIEANPETVTPGLLDDLLVAGVNRISLGMQSADSSVLAVLDRTHTPGRAVEAAQQAQSAGFDRVSLDLIYGSPGESLDSWRSTVRTALATGVSHVSAYALKVETGTALHRRVVRREVATPNDDAAADSYEIADQEFLAAGLPWYEISNWARPGHECRHNLGYWHGADWLGIGPGSHSHVGARRSWNEKNPVTWIAATEQGRNPEAGFELLSPATQLTEFVMLRLRLAEGLPLHALSDLLPEADALNAVVRDLADDGLTRVREGRLVLTRRGRLLADEVTLRLLP